MNRQKLLSSIKQSFMVKRYKAQEECEEFINSLRQNSLFNQFYSELTKKHVKIKT